MASTTDKVNLLLVSAPHNFGWPWGKGNFYRGFYEYLGTGYLAAACERDGVSVKILDAPFHGWGPRQTADEIRKRDFDVLGISANWQQFFPQTSSLLNLVRDLNKPILLGGHFPTIAHREIMADFPHLTAVGIGEAESSLPEAVRTLARKDSVADVAGMAIRGTSTAKANMPVPGHTKDSRDLIINTGTIPLCVDLDKLPFPLRPQADVYRAAKNPGLASASLLSSRGCGGHCSFCTIHAFQGVSPGPRWRARSPENVVAEIEMLQKDYGFTHFRFVDEDFFGRCPEGRRRAEEIARLIVSRGIKMNFELFCRADEVDPDILRQLKEAGLDMVYLSLDAATEEDIELYNKGTTRKQMVDSVKFVYNSGVQLAYSFIFWHPYRRLRDMTKAFSILDEASQGDSKIYASMLKGLETGIIADLDVLTGSPLEKKIREDGLLKGDYRHYTYGFTHTSTRVAYFFLRGYKKIRSVAQNLSNTKQRPKV